MVSVLDSRSSGPCASPGQARISNMKAHIYIYIYAGMFKTVEMTKWYDG